MEAILEVIKILVESERRRGFREGFRRAWVELKPLNWGPDQWLYCETLLQEYLSNENYERRTKEGKGDE